MSFARVIEHITECHSSSRRQLTHASPRSHRFRTRRGWKRITANSHVRDPSLVSRLSHRPTGWQRWQQSAAAGAETTLEDHGNSETIFYDRTHDWQYENPSVKYRVPHSLDINQKVSYRSGLYPSGPSQMTAEGLIDNADDKLLDHVLRNGDHVLHELLPERVNIS